ncbi:hypothetical protein J1N35_038796 [Gossypium stocksii]|uniref:Reverse transcriptase domain-containing protein n=1 Tax=Gossypium stocksii TaxID=47602 RepID=A0A9D3UMK3_9ROSI|nr:hypothetical protein J1N35_038796 [Gossypium stocksii]
MQSRLTEWARLNRRNKGGLKKRLSKELEQLLAQERDDETLAKIIDTKIHLNLEIEKDEMEEEIRDAIKWTGPTKAPGPDGFPAIFFQKYWDIVGKDVVDYCLGILNDKKEVNSVNLTDIMLIPKVQNP